MMTTSIASRRQRLLRAVLAAIALAAFSYGFGADERLGLWRGVGAVGAVGSVVALVWAIRIFRTPDDHLRILEPDPRNNPETRRRRSAVSSLLASTGVLALVSGIGGFGFDGAVWWRGLLIGIGWPLLLLGGFQRVLTSREGRARTRV